MNIPSRFFTYFMVLFAAVSFSLPARAEVLTGDLSQVSPQGSSFTISRKDTKQKTEIWLLTETRFNGLSSLHELEAGDEIVVSVQKNPDNGRLEADSVRVSKIVLHDPKSDVEILREFPQKSASALSIEEEGKSRAKKEMRLQLEQRNKEFERVRLTAENTPGLREKIAPVLKDYESRRKAAVKSIEALERSSPEAWEGNRSAAEKSLQELDTFLEDLKRQGVV